MSGEQSGKVNEVFSRAIETKLDMRKSTSQSVSERKKEE